MNLVISTEALNIHMTCHVLLIVGFSAGIILKTDNKTQGFNLVMQQDIYCKNCLVSLHYICIDVNIINGYYDLTYIYIYLKLISGYHNKCKVLVREFWWYCLNCVPRL